MRCRRRFLRECDGQPGDTLNSGGRYPAYAETARHNMNQRAVVAEVFDADRFDLDREVGRGTTLARIVQP